MSHSHVTTPQEAKSFLGSHQPLPPSEAEWTQELLNSFIQCLKVLDEETSIDEETQMLLVGCVSSDLYSHRHQLSSIIAYSDIRLLENKLSEVLRKDQY